MTWLTRKALDKTMVKLYGEEARIEKSIDDMLPPFNTNMVKRKGRMARQSKKFMMSFT